MQFASEQVKLDQVILYYSILRAVAWCIWCIKNALLRPIGK